MLGFNLHPNWKILEENIVYSIHVIYVVIRCWYIPRTQMTLILVRKGLCFEGLTFKNSGQLGSRYTYI